MKPHVMLLMAFSALCVGASAQENTSSDQEKSSLPVSQKIDQKMTKEDAKQILEAADGEFKELSARSRAVSTRIGELALAGDLRSAEAVDELKKLLAELQDVNARLAALEEFMAMVKGWIEGQNEALPIMAFDIAQLKKAQDSNYVQFQFRDTNAPGSGRQHSFMLRRVRLGGKWVVDPRTEMKVSFDVATGSNQIAAELKDAILTWKIMPSDTTAGTSLIAGQFSMPLGYEIARSSSIREFPERSRYNLQMFNGERVRGVMVEHGVDAATTLFVGLMNSMSIKDAEQNNLTPGPGGRMAGFAGVNFATPNSAFGVSYMNGKRPMTATAPEITRQFWYGHAEYIGLFVPDLWVRAEGMRGSDRIPGTATGAQDMDGYHVILGYNLDEKNQIFGKWSDFDPNKDVDFNSYREYGVGYRYYINPGAMFTTTYEIIENQAASQVRTNVLVFRYQFKF